MKVTGVLSIKCDDCGYNHSFSPQEADFVGTSSMERQMGPEHGYAWEHDFVCDCGNQIEFEYAVQEYPEGAFNHEEINISGGKEIKMFDYNFH